MVAVRKASEGHTCTRARTHAYTLRHHICMPTFTQTFTHTGMHSSPRGMHAILPAEETIVSTIYGKLVPYMESYTTHRGDNWEKVPECQPDSLEDAFYTSCGTCTESTCVRYEHFATPVYETGSTMNEVTQDVLLSQLAIRDGNAFLVYYTQGFDGPGRPSIEQDSAQQVTQKAQFGLRNDAWVAVDAARSEVQYLRSQSL